MTDIDMNGAAAPEQGPSQPQDLAINNHSGILPMLWIGFYTSVLSLFTLTIFRFWGRTQFRRRLWADTTIGNEPLEYTGRGLELFLGALMAIFTVMLPLVAGLILLQVFVGAAGFATGVIILYVAVFVLIGAAIFLARRYHLSRTTFRGVRFAQTGSALGYGLQTLGYLIITGLSLGWAGPTARIALSRALWKNAYYGDEKFQFIPNEESRREPVYASFAVMWVGGVALYAAVIAAVVHLGLFERIKANDLKALGIVYALAFGFSILFLFFAAWHEAVITRRITKSLVLGDLRFSSRITMWDIISVSLTNVFLIIFTLGFGFMASQMRLWKLHANRMSVNGTIDFDKIRQNADRGPSHGEGLADGLDIAANF